VILSFDVEEHFRIEAAAALRVSSAQRAHYASRLETSCAWLLDSLDILGLKATFFVVGQIAQSHPQLVRRMAEAGHEVASHSWDHRRIHQHTPLSFREDVRQSRDALEQVTGQSVLGYRAPTFSVVKQTAWALDVLAESGFVYDSSIFPVRHDRYGVPDAPRVPFRARGSSGEILELPPATWRVCGLNVPVGGGGFFRLLPQYCLEKGLEQLKWSDSFQIATLYFHPWEFDPGQARLPLGKLSSLRTYVGLFRSRPRLLTLLRKHAFCRALDAASQLNRCREQLPVFDLVPDSLHVPATEWDSQNQPSLPARRILFAGQ